MGKNKSAVLPRQQKSVIPNVKTHVKRSEHLGEVGPQVQGFVDRYPEQIYWPTVECAGDDPKSPLPPNIRRFTKVVNQPKHWLRPFLDELASTGLLQRSCDIAGVTREVVMIHRRQNTLFAYAYEDAMLRSTEKLELAARERALEYSDPLMIFLLKGNNPDKFGDKISVRTETQVRNKVNELAEKMGLDPDEILALATEILENWTDTPDVIDITPADDSA